ncbi:MAG: tRNA (N6-isopentenyl adenosine(37)-C2)-methylthiotransferase MiaB [Emergencia timonensis]|uniref:tRNA (N6-isopentenyl adenosine(37)-C2)-methylthiotransferase MiaB n=1 Tax=Emergencia timonensis TaxID=1776384 RepID=UPI0008341E6A|nr:tRNA (N6-isopentenyl adenosine(37)-C2)-methylthiotransferase MiaB [Emergencia timonensis]WNX86887.1 tRNA (N6-isopentenyl adenosine(37)-C2)-methylthiotransferase MiaB [Emergencia timonensis]
MSKTFHITTFGCQMNEHDSEVMAGMLLEKGFEPVKERRDADVAIINTCSVRENADKRFFGTLGQLKRRKKENPDFVVCVCGCMMQQQHVIDTIKAKYPWVDIIFGTHNIHQFPELVDNALNEKKKQIEVWSDGGDIVEGLPAKRLFDCKALVNIMFGCNNFCTYCIVPYTRGRERSRQPEEIIKEVKSLVEDGVKEIMLLGQNVNSYRGDEQTDFARLLYRLNEIEGLERIRFMTSHPKDLSDRLIQAFVDCNKLCKNIHLPVQSGSSRVLKKMNRRYTKEQYLELVAKLKAAVPGITMSTDIIVGFPGETEEDFEETLDLVRKVRFDSAFTFLYSIRKGTPAEKYEDQVPEEVKHERFNRLVDLINAISAEKNGEYAGRVERVLVEGASKTNSKTFSGRTDGFKLVNFEGTKDMVGNLVDVEIIEGKTFSLDGRIVK